MPTRFHPDDYPAYRFAENGTPTRTATPSRGPYAGIPNREVRPTIRKSDGREVFSLIRHDGASRLVSRNQIRETCSPDASPHTRNLIEPPEGFIPLQGSGFDGYAYHPGLDKVIRYYSYSAGPLIPPVELARSEYVYTPVGAHGPPPPIPFYTLWHAASGTRKRVTLDKLLKAAGLTLSDVVLARSRPATPLPPRGPRVDREAVAAEVATRQAAHDAVVSAAKEALLAEQQAHKIAAAVAALPPPSSSSSPDDLQQP